MAEFYLPDSEGTSSITIEMFDEVSGVCSGTLSLKLANNESVPQLLTSHNARFSVPIYRN